MTSQAEELSEYLNARAEIQTRPPQMTWEDCAKTIAVELGISELVLWGYSPEQVARLVVSNLRYCGLSHGLYLPGQGPNMTDVVKDDDTRIEDWFKVMKSNLVANGLHLTGRGNPSVKWAFEE